MHLSYVDALGEPVFEQYPQVVKRRRNFLLFLIFVLILATGYIRDYVFKSINALMKAWDFDMEYIMPPALRFFENMEYETIEQSKWILTLFFTLVYLAITMLTLKIIFPQRSWFRISAYTYGAIILISALLMGIGFVAPSQAESMYGFSRYLMGLAQSPIVLMVLIPALKLSQQEKPKITN
jgi:hypothetical protein